MSPAKLALFLFAGALSAQVVPGRFILELAEPPTGRVRGARSVRLAQTAARSALATRLGSRVEVKDFTEVVMNSLIVRSTANESALAAIPGVRRVWPVYEIRPELDRAVILHQVTKAWETVGGTDRAGAGIKIGILDSGIDLSHPGFQTDSLPIPDSFPRSNNEDIRARLNGKVIVYRTYDAMINADESPVDYTGHGTGVAMAAAGVRVTGPRGELQGVAPAAWLGVYKMFVGPLGFADTSTALKALDDAAADGMDVLNLSWGFRPQVRPEYDPLLPAIERAASLGIGVIKSAGNSGPARLSGSTPNVGGSGLAIGATLTDRVFVSGIRVNSGPTIYGIPGNGPLTSAHINAPIKDIDSLDPTGLACTPLPTGSLTGAAALILRGGVCNFETKIKAAEAAGAVAAIIYSTPASPNPGAMNVGTARLPAVMIGNKDGVALKAALADAEATVELSLVDDLPYIIGGDDVFEISSRGPGADGSIRPDLVAVGEEFQTAAQKTNRNGELYDPSGFTVTFGGTSFSAPLVSGAYAVLKAHRPGLSAGQYRSLLTNSAEPFPAERPAPVQVGGAGRLDLQSALRGRLSMSPVSLSFGLGGQRMDATRNLRVQNVTPGIGTWKVEIDSADNVKATVEPAEFSLGPSDTIDLTVRLSGDLPVGEIQGFLLFRPLGADESERPQRVAYWYGVPSGRPATILVNPPPPPSASPGETVILTVLITDPIGAATPFEAPKVTVLEGGGDLVSANTAEAVFPGYWEVRLRLGAATGQRNRFRIEAGAAVREVSIQTR